jgi:RNA polymerase sigma factor (sigma-70 family)
VAVPGVSSDARLARRAARGDRGAFAEIFARHHQAIYRYCRSILRDDEDAADALQSTMAAAMRGLEGETREIALKPWLFRIAHNESLSLVRQRRPQASVDDVELPARSGPESEVLASERLRELVGRERDQSTNRITTMTTAMTRATIAIVRVSMARPYSVFASRSAKPS